MTEATRRGGVNLFQRMLLSGLNTRGLRKHIYSGTVDPAEVAKRRKANKVARASRRKNRRK